MSTTFNMDSMFRVCAICGKELPVRNVNGYQYRAMINGKRAYFCSYTCDRKYRKENENGRVNQQERGD